jgi:hypothetical protein
VSFLVEAYISMPQLQYLTEEQVQQSFRRAQEIAHQHAPPSAVIGEQLEGQTDIDSFLAAAEELGVPREAAIQSLREQMLLPMEEITVGTLVFAPSADGRHYPATIVRSNGSTVVVNFISGGEHTVTAASLHPLSLIPGQTIEFEDKDWGWVGGTIKSYDAAKQKLELSSMWETKKTSLGKVRLAVPKKKTSRELKVRQLIWRTALIAGSAGTAIGWIIGHFAR